jgi:hypothetical protein
MRSINFVVTIPLTTHGQLYQVSLVSIRDRHQTPNRGEVPWPQDLAPDYSNVSVEGETAPTGHSMLPLQGAREYISIWNSRVLRNLTAGLFSA